MEKLNSLFSKFDQFIFDQIDQIRKSPAYEQVSAKFDQLTSEQQKIANRILSFTAIFLPVLIVFLVFLGNYSRKNDLDEKLQITSVINQINFKRSIIQSLGNQFLSGEALEDESSLLLKINSFLNGTGINRDQLAITNFETFSIADSLQKSEANLKFTKMTTEGLSNLLEQLLKNSNFKVSNIEVVRTSDLKIDGDLRIHYYGKK